MRLKKLRGYAIGGGLLPGWSLSRHIEDKSGLGGRPNILAIRRRPCFHELARQVHGRAGAINDVRVNDRP